MAMQTIGLLTRFGATTYVAVVVGLSMVKELGPVITALMVAGRAGSGMSAEIGSMKVTNQIDALKVLAVDPVRYLVTTRIVATVVVLPILTAIADVVGIGGGMLMGVTQGGIGTRLYIETTFRFIKLEDILSGLSKTIIFGLLIALIATYEGFKTKGGTAGVGLATTSTMVLSSLLI
ncbi:MAG: ABC transporter permease, partial [Spirochaetes bacterium]